MANSILKWGQTTHGTGTYYALLDTTATLELGQAATGNVGSFLVQLQGTFSGSAKAQLVAPGGADLGTAVTPIQVPLTNVNTNTEIAAATGATATGLYKFNADHGMMASLLVTLASGSVQVLIRRGDG